MNKLLIVMVFFMMFLFSGCATFTSMSNSVNTAGIKEYKLVNSSMCDDPEHSYLFDKLHVNATYDYVEKTNTVKVTLTNVGQKRIGGEDGSDAMITGFTLFSNNRKYGPDKCDQPISNGTYATRGHVENSLSCYYNKNIFSTITASSQFSYKINFNRPNVGDLNTLKATLNDPISYNSIACQRLMNIGYTYEQCVVSLWSQMPSKRFTSEVMHIRKDQKTNLVKFGSCIQNDSCQ